MNETFNFEFWRWHFNTDNFKQKQAIVIINTIIGGRLGNDMKFSGYGNFSYDKEDEGHRYPTITILDDFTRGKTNCLVFDMYNTDKNSGKFDKMFIYQSNGPRDGHFGYVFMNTSTGQIMHKYYIDHMYDELCNQINKSLIILKRQHMFDFYSKKYDSIKNRIDENYGALKDYENHFGFAY